MRRSIPAIRFARTTGWVILVAVVAGCGGDLKVAPVTGTVTLDGAPLAKASVLFQPDAGGRPSFAVTDQNGKYTLAYSMQEQGAEVGSCTVKISTVMQPEDSDGSDSRTKKPPAERVPARYEKEPVVVKVAPKPNTIDIALTTKP